MTRLYQQQLDHLNTIVEKLHRHKNLALNRRNPIDFVEWFSTMEALLSEVDDEEANTIRILKENELPENPTEEEKISCYVGVLNDVAHMLANKKQQLRVNDYVMESGHYFCAGDGEYEIIANEFKVDGETVRLEPAEMTVMKMILSKTSRDIRATEIAKELSDDEEYVIEAPHIISDINSKIKRGRTIQNPIRRKGGERLPSGRIASIWHLCLRSESD